MDETNRIVDLYAREILDSRGNPTIEVELYTGEFIGTAAVPSGASTGRHEAHELRDNGKRYDGKGVRKAVKNVNEIIKPALIGVDTTKQEVIDDALIALDGTRNKEVLGANAILGVSLAASRAGAAAKEMFLYEYLSTTAGTKPKLPIIFSNVINGGKHSANDLMVQEFMIVATKGDLKERIRVTSEAYHELKRIVTKKYGSSGVGDEGGFAPPISDPEEALKLLMRIIKGRDMMIALDAAASDFYKKKYEIKKGTRLTGKELGRYWLKLLKKYPIISLEDPFAEDDIESWKEFMKELKKTPLNEFKTKKRPQIVGDDLTVTNPERIKKAIEEELCNALLLKTNQIGTLTESIRAFQLAIGAGWKVMVSHRSGETEDPYIADLATGLGCGQIKIGAPCRSERTAKYNQLIRISEDIKSNAR